MQTFLTSERFAATAAELDNKRLNKQSLEAWQIMMTLTQLDPDGNHREPRGWVNHPAVKMWRGCEHALWHYIQSMVAEWVQRGYKSTVGDKSTATLLQASKLGLVDLDAMPLPVWMNDSALFAQILSSHRTALLAKNYDWYSQFNWAEDTGVAPESYEYVWGQAA